MKNDKDTKFAASINAVREFHLKFGVPCSPAQSGDSFPLYMLSPEAAKFRIEFLREETEEFAGSIGVGDTVVAFDSLLDLAYVAYGTALMMGITPEQWSKGFSAVHECNMAKVRATSPEQSKRGSTLDVIKPEGWIGPEETLKAILYGGN